ncbi:MAG: hypothetical protein ACXVXO_00725 [Mycobacteriaceae bacterium]
MKAPVESKVIAATAGGASGGVVGSFILWLLGVVVWHVPNDAAHSVQAVAAVPEPVGGFALFLLAGLCAFWAGYRAPHTPRPDLIPGKALVAPDEPPVVHDPTLDA